MMRSNPWFRVSIVGVSCLALVVGAMMLPLAQAAEETKPKHTIKDVMKLGHKDGLLKKILKGDASEDDKKKLLDLYISMVESKPSRGDINSWHNLAGKATVAAAKVVVGREGAEKELEAATNCKACHSVHKPA